MSLRSDLVKDPPGFEELERRLTSRGAPYALERVETINGGILRFTYGPKDLVELFKTLGRRGNKKFITTCSDEKTYEEIFLKARSLSVVLRRNYNIGRGDYVALMAGNSSEWVTAFFSIVAVGGVPVLLHAIDSENLRCQLSLVNCKLLVTDRSDQAFASRSVFPGPIVTTDVVANEELAHRFPFNVKMDVGKEIPASVSPLDQAVIAFTSGSTGTPKAVVLTQRGVTTGLMNMMLAACLCDTSRKRERKFGNPAGCAFVQAPLFHVSGYVQVLLAIMLGNRVVFMKEWNAREAVALMDNEAVTSICGLNSIQADELLQANFAENRLRSLRSWNISGMAGNPNIIRKIHQALPNVFVTASYGLTETNGGICSIDGRAALENPADVGRLVPTVKVKITDDKGDLCDVSVCGDIWLCGDMLMLGYRSETDDLSGLYDGWFRTGDAGYMTPEGKLVVVDRRDQILSVGNRKISAVEVERLVRSQKGIADVCACKMDFGGRGARMVIAVVLTLDPDSASPAEIIAKLTNQLELGYSAPLIFPCEKLPVNASGKVNQAKLKSLASTYAKDRL